MSYLSGFDDTLRKLAGLGSKGKKAIRRGTRAGAKILQSVIKQKAPVLTGKLKAAIKVRALPRSRKWVGTCVTLKSIVSLNGVFYGAFLEFGTKRITALHFMEQAIKTAGARARETAISVITQEMKKQ